MPNSGAYRQLAHAATRAYIKISVFSLSPLTNASSVGPCFIFFSHVVFAGGVISDLFVLLPVPCLVCFFIAGVRLVVLMGCVGCIGSYGTMSCGTGTSVRSISSVVFAGNEGFGFMGIVFVCILGRMLSGGALFVRILWWGVMLCVM